MKEKYKILTFAICNLQFAILLSGCVSFQVGGEIQPGRMELMYGDPKLALARFQRAAELDPDYRLNFSLLNQGVWTYVGRANYASGRLPEARQALETARSRYEHDNLARLYLGLVLARQGERDRGLSEVEAGLKGLEDWFAYIENYTRQGRFWDPTRKIRSEIRTNLAMIERRSVNWEEFPRNLEWLGLELEKEIDLARRDDWEDRTREGGRNGR